MKQIPQILYLLLFLSCPFFAFSQIGSAETQVNVLIGQVISIEVTQPSVNIDMGLSTHYINGSSSGQQTNHIKVTSNNGYEINVRATTEYFSLNGNMTTLPVNTIMIATSLGDDLTGSGSAAPASLQINNPVPLSTSNTNIVSSGEGESARGFHVTYSIPASQTSNYLNKEPGTYTTNVIYTVVPQ